MNLPTMADRVDEYLAYRRALGYQIGIEGQLLQSFARYADESGHRGPLTIELALRWARLPEKAVRLYHARRLEIVRALAKYLAPREPGTEVPGRGLLGPAHARKPPFIYSEADIIALIAAARTLTSDGGLRPRTYVALIGLLACTGLRIREALTLKTSDVDLDAGVLTVRQTKFRKSRLVPLHASAVEPLRGYVAERDARCRGPRDRALLRLGCGSIAALFDCAAHLPPAPAAGYAGGDSTESDTAAPPRHATHVCLPMPAGLVPQRDGHSSGHRPTLSLPGPRQGHRYLLVSDGHTGVAGTCRPAL